MGGGKRHLTRYALFANRDDRVQDVNLLERHNSQETICEWSPKLPCGGTFFYDKNTLAIRDPFSPLAPMTLFHELRHAKQEHSLPLALREWYMSVLDRDYTVDEKYREEFLRDGPERLVKILVLTGVFSKETEARTALKDIFTSTERYRKASASVQEARSQNMFDISMNDAVFDARNALASIPKASSPIVHSLTLKDILRLPTLFLERDAEYGALIALRALEKETGINLLHNIPEGYQGKRRAEKAPHIDTLAHVHDYMNTIGVNLSCVRKARATERRKAKAHGA